MGNQQTSCREEVMKEALLQKRVPEILPCLKYYFDRSMQKIFNTNTPKEVKEDVFWYAAFALNKKSETTNINLTSSVYGYFYGYVKNYWKTYLNNRKKMPFDSLDQGQHQDFFLIDSFLPNLEDKEQIKALEQCLSELDDRGKIIIQAFCAGEKDEKTAVTLGIQRKSVSVIRKRCFNKLKACLKAHHPELF